MAPSGVSRSTASKNFMDRQSTASTILNLNPFHIYDSRGGRTAIELIRTR